MTPTHALAVLRAQVDQYTRDRTGSVQTVESRMIVENALATLEEAVGTSRPGQVA